MNAYRKPACKVTIVLVSLSLCIVMATEVRSDYTYSYNGQPFTIFFQNWDEGYTNISGSVTLTAQLPLNSTSTNYQPVSFNFTDGPNVYNQTNSDYAFYFATANGIITGWSVAMMTGIPDPLMMYDAYHIYTVYDKTQMYFNEQAVAEHQGPPVQWDPVIIPGPLITNTAYASAPGQWSNSSVPIPTTLLLLGSGLLGLFGFRRKLCK